MATNPEGKKDKQPKPDDTQHDILFIAKNETLYRFPVDRNGTFTRRPSPLSIDDTGYRKTMSVAAPEGSDKKFHGTAFGVMPNKPDPAVSSMTCYVTNARNIQIQNDWTSAEWSSEPQVDGPDDAAAGGRKSSGFGEGDFEVLLAAPDGQVFFVQKKAGQPAPKITDVKVQYEGEIWSQLRNGLIAGTVAYYQHPDGANRVVPLVNVTSLKKGGK
jgi:hypothetical protein